MKNYVEKAPVPLANQVKDATVIAAMPTANLIALRSVLVRALLQVAQM